MKILAYIIGVLLLIIIATIIAVPFLVSPQFIEQQLVRSVQEQTGFELRLEQDSQFRFFPEIGLTLGGITLQNPARRQGTPLLRAKNINVGLQFWPLLSGQYKVSTFTIDSPKIYLHIDRDGTSNWQMAGILHKSYLQKAAISVTPQNLLLKTALLNMTSQETLPSPSLGTSRTILVSQSQPHAPAQNPLEGLNNLSLGKVRLYNGTLIYEDAFNEQYEQITNLNMELAMPSIKAPLVLDADFKWKHLPLAIQANIEHPENILQGIPSPVAFSLTSIGTQISTKGLATMGQEERLYKGSVDVNIHRINDLLTPLGMAVPALENAGKLTLQGEADLGLSRQSLNRLKLALGKTQATGNISLHTATTLKKPYLKASLDFAKLNLNPFLGGNTSVRGWTRRTEISGFSSSRMQMAQNGNIGDLLRRLEGEEGLPSPRKRGQSRPPVTANSSPLQALTLLDGDMDIHIATLIYQNFTLRNNNVKASLKNRHLNLQLKQAHLYDGKITGQARINMARSLPTIAVRFNIANMPARPLLNDVADFDWLSGRTHITGNLTTRGLSDPRIRKNLNGSVSIEFTDGAIEGINIAKSLRGLSTGSAFGLAKNTTEKTDFSELSGRFSIKNGIASNTDMIMVSPLLRVSGKGNIDLVREQIDYLATPKIVGSLKGQGGSRDMAGLAIPFKIKGKLASPSIKPDLQALLKDPASLLKGAKSLEKSLRNLDKNGQVGEFLGGLLGGGKKKEGGDLLKDLFR